MPKAKRPKAKQNVPRGVRTGLDAQALAWAAILNDPCAAPLAHPCYAGADGGILVRVETSYDIGIGGTDTAGALFWTPGATGNNAGFAAGLVPATAINSVTAMTGVSISAATQPGYTYLLANASTFRTVAACMQITYLGTEANRSGVINYGNANGSTFNVGDAVASATLANVLEKFERTPVGTVEVKWRPSAFDQTFKEPALNPTAAELARYQSLGLAFSGLVAAAGLRVRLVAVYEYTPINNLGVANVSSSRNTSSSSMDHVINFLDSSGDWMYRASGSLARAARGAASLEPFVRAVTYGGARVAGLLM